MTKKVELGPNSIDYICALTDTEWEYAVRYGSALYLRGCVLSDCFDYADLCNERYGAGSHVVVRRPKEPEWEVVEGQP